MSLDLARALVEVTVQLVVRPESEKVAVRGNAHAPAFGVEKAYFPHVGPVAVFLGAYVIVHKLRNPGGVAADEGGGVAVGVVLLRPPTVVGYPVVLGLEYKGVA